MKNKRKYIAITMVILLIIVTNVTTFIVANGVSLVLGDKVIINTGSVDTAKYIKKVLYLKDEILRNYYKDVDEKVLLDGAIAGMFSSVGDPYTSYYNEEQFQSYLEQIQGSYVGIGVVVGMNEDNLVEVVSPIEGSPGQRAGLKTGDVIIEVDGEDVTKLTLEEVVAKIKGKEGTKVTVGIRRGAQQELIEKEIIREEIIMTSVDSMVLEGDIGYISISQFETNTADEFNEHLDKLLEKDVRGFIFDVRDNPGGMMDVVVEMIDRLIGESIIVYTEDKAGNRETMTSDEETKLDLPMVVLINKGSASASEIFAGALQDVNAATIVGETSFGKGIVQRMSDLGDGTGYKITVSEYFTPNGRNIHEKGIEPDIEVKMSDEDRGEKQDSFKDVQLEKAIEIMRDKIKE